MTADRPAAIGPVVAEIDAPCVRRRTHARGNAIILETAMQRSCDSADHAGAFAELVARTSHKVVGGRRDDAARARLLFSDVVGAFASSNGFEQAERPAAQFTGEFC